jgi:hypothetical protein
MAVEYKNEEITTHNPKKESKVFPEVKYIHDDDEDLAASINYEEFTRHPKEYYSLMHKDIETIVGQRYEITELKRKMQGIEEKTIEQLTKTWEEKLKAIEIEGNVQLRNQAFWTGFVLALIFVLLLIFIGVLRF